MLARLFPCCCPKDPGEIQMVQSANAWVVPADMPMKVPVRALLNGKANDVLTLTLILNGQQKFDQTRVNPATQKVEPDQEASIAMKVHRLVSAFLASKSAELSKKPIVKTIVKLPEHQIKYTTFFIKLADPTKQMLSIVLSTTHCYYFVLVRDGISRSTVKPYAAGIQEDTYTERILYGDKCCMLSQGSEQGEPIVSLDTQMFAGDGREFIMTVDNVIRDDKQLNRCTITIPGEPAMVEVQEEGIVSKPGTRSPSASHQSSLKKTEESISFGGAIFSPEAAKRQIEELEKIEKSRTVSRSQESLEFKAPPTEEGQAAPSADAGDKKVKERKIHQRRSQMLREEQLKAKKDTVRPQSNSLDLSRPKEKPVVHQSHRSHSDQDFQRMRDDQPGGIGEVDAQEGEGEE